MKNTMMLSRRSLLVSASALTLSATLSACGGNLLGPDEAGQIYALNPAPAAAPAGLKVPWALAVIRPGASSMLDTDRIALAKSDGTMDYFAKSQYPDRLPSIVRMALVSAFEASNRIDAVSGGGDALHADYILTSEIKNFEARYDQADGVPTAQVVITAKLATSRGRKIVGTFNAQQSVAATANSAGAATAALQTALSAAVSAIVAWTLTFPAPAAPPAP